LSEYTLVPYVNENGTWTLPDDFLLAMAQKTQEEGTFQHVFYEGDIRTPPDFLAMMKLQSNIAVFAFKENRPVGFAWLNGVMKNIAFAHFCFLKDSWGKDTVEAGKQIIDYWQKFRNQGGDPLFDVLFGVTPSGYGSALKYIQRLGFVRMGVVPGMLQNAYAGERDSAVLSYLSRFENDEV
tara:strand:+ start:1201 stop:1743 length:543 start_codon:yes stop_codon:yes gene_type:complete